MSDPVLGVLPPRTEAFQWHHYTFAVPDGATELARSDVCTQAFRVGERAWGIQFHAEVTIEMVRAWTSEDPDRPAGYTRRVPRRDARPDRRLERARPSALRRLSADGGLS